MYEELLMDEEGLKKTDNKMIYDGRPIEFDEKKFETQLERLSEDVKRETGDVRKTVQDIIGTYHYE